MDRIGRHNNVEYALISQSMGRVVIDEPINYDKGNGNIYERDKNSKGFVIKKNDALEFYGSGFDTLITQVSTKGIAEDMSLEKIEKDRTRLDEEWRSFPPMYLDLGTLEWEEKEGGKGVAKVKTTEGGLKKMIDSKLNDEIDLTALVDIEGNVIGPLERENIFLEPKEILLTSVLEVQDGTEMDNVFRSGDRDNVFCIPFKATQNSDSNNVISVENTNAGVPYDNGNYVNGNIGAVMYLQSDTDKAVNINGTVNITPGRSNQGGNIYLEKVWYSFSNDELIYSNKETLASVQVGQSLSYTFTDDTVYIDENESFAIVLRVRVQDYNFGPEHVRYIFNNTRLVLKENSGELSAPTNSKCLTYKAALERMLYMITGEETVVESDLLTTGELSEDILANGFWIRGFPDVVQEGTDEERKIQFKTSIGNLFKHIYAIMPFAYWIETGLDKKEKLRLESLKYTQQNFVGVPFCKTTSNRRIYPQANKIKRATLKDNFYSKIELGSMKGGDGYEEVYGLQSISGRATFNTINKKNESVYSFLSPYRLGDVDVELARRKPFTKFAEEDTQYDSDIMAIRAKKSGSSYRVKRWSETYETAPTGIYRVGSAYNIEFTPAQFLLSHGSEIAAGLYHHPSSKLVFAESNCNSSLVTKKAGELPLRESPDPNTGLGVIPLSRLDQPRFKPTSVDCEIQVTQEIEDYINGFTDGVPNIFGLVAVNTGLQIEYFRMIKTDANDEGKHKFIESFIT